MATQTTLYVDQGALFEQSLEFLDGTEPAYDFTGATARMQVRPFLGSPDILAAIATDPSSNGLLILGGDLGTLDIVIEAAATAALPLYGPPPVYDISVLLAGASSPIRVVQGTIVVSGAVTLASNYPGSTQ